MVKTGKWWALKLSPVSERLVVALDLEVARELLASEERTYRLLSSEEARVIPLGALEDPHVEALASRGETLVEEVPPAEVKAEVWVLTDPGGPLVWVRLPRATGAGTLLEGVLSPEAIQTLGA